MKYFVVDSFTKEPFKGNPAGVCIVESFPSAEIMQKIAKENRLSETAFACQKAPGEYQVRFFTPGSEIDLCGHATLGTSYVLSHFVEPEQKEFHFHANHDELTIRCLEGDLFEMDFPAWKAEPVAVTGAMKKALGFTPEGAWLTRDLMFLVKDAETVRNFQPDLAAIEAVPEGCGFFLTAENDGEESDFVCRTFFPKIAIDEDPVCGSANCTLIPFWSERLGKKDLVNYQLSERTGFVYGEDAGERVKIKGHVALYSVGEINIH